MQTPGGSGFPDCCGVEAFGAGEVHPARPPVPLHLGWVRRPLVFCRAVLLGLLLPDPCDPLCPEEFKKEAREVLASVQGEVGLEGHNLRRALLRFIGDFANWDPAANRTRLAAACVLVKAVHPEETR